MVLGLAFAIGVVAGLRSFTAPAAVCWAAHLGWLQLDGSKLEFLGTTTAVCISTVLALTELVLDKTHHHGCIVGRGAWFNVGRDFGRRRSAYGGYYARRWIVSNLKVPDIAVALVEDALAVGGALLIVSRF